MTDLLIAFYGLEFLVALAFITGAILTSCGILRVSMSRPRTRAKP